MYVHRIFNVICKCGNIFFFKTGRTSPLLSDRLSVSFVGDNKEVSSIDGSFMNENMDLPFDSNYLEVG